MEAYDLLERYAIMIDGGAEAAAAIAFIKKTYPETLENGAFNAFLETIGQDAAKGGQGEQAKADFDTLRQYIEAGFTLYAQKEGFNDKVKRYPVDWREAIGNKTKAADNERAAVKTESDLRAAIENGVKLFAFLPSERDFLCFDIDKGHQDGVDGLEVFAAYFAKRGIEYDFFDARAVYTETPSGGRHLYFKDWTKTERYLSEPFDNVEVRGRGNRKTLTAAGSVKNGKAYGLRGLLKDAPNLPNMLVKHITPAPRKAAKASSPGRKSFNGKRGEYALGQLVDFALQDNQGRGRNDTAYYIGLRIGGLYDLESVIAECQGRPVFADFPEYELRNAVKSGMKNSRH